MPKLKSERRPSAQGKIKKRAAKKAKASTKYKS
jgi:hypothetical protein